MSGNIFGAWEVDDLIDFLSRLPRNLPVFIGGRDGTARPLVIMNSLCNEGGDYTHVELSGEELE